MEVRTSATRTCLDDLGVGVKSQSNSAMAGSCQNILSYSLFFIGQRGRVTNKTRRRVFLIGVFFNSEFADNLGRETGAGGKLPFRNSNKRAYG